MHQTRKMQYKRKSRQNQEKSLEKLAFTLPPVFRRPALSVLWDSLNHVNEQRGKSCTTKKNQFFITNFYHHILLTPLSLDGV